MPMAFPLAIAESVQVTAVLQMLNRSLLPRLPLSLQSRLAWAPAQKCWSKYLV